MSTTVIGFNGKKEEEVLASGYTFGFDWSELLPELKSKINIRDDEEITGIIISQTRISIKVMRKRAARKTRVKKES